MKAYELSRLDKEKMIHELAWETNQAGATKTVGKKTVPVYQSFDEFFNYKEKERSILGIDETSEQDKKIKNLLFKANS